jgi:hypothetical protein
MVAANASGRATAIELLAGCTYRLSTIAAPEAFALRVTQAGTAGLTWNPPSGGGHDGFRVVSLSGMSIDLGPTVGSRNLPLSGFDCFMVLAVRTGAPIGNTDIACGLTVVSTLGQ